MISTVRSEDIDELIGGQDPDDLFAQLAQTAKDPRLAAFYQAGAVAADTPLEQVPLVALERAQATPSTLPPLR